MGASRFAIYFTPARESPLWTLGVRWLGRDDDNVAHMRAPLFDPLADHEHAAITAAPRHYGFHATLKAPFALAEGCRPEELAQAVSSFAKAHPPFLGPPLRVGMMKRFAALLPTRRSETLERFANECVRAFDRFRRAETPEQIARRPEQELTPRQRSLLAAWGYPFVFEEFRFHMTLTGRLDSEQEKRILPLFNRHFSDITQTALWIDAVSLVRQPDRERPFTLVARHPLRG